jgi:two-component system alkaline phosphatase synthesis response regulator PhoP
MKHKVLIVEDEPEILSMMKEELSCLYEVFSAENSRNGEQLARKHLPDVALLDVRLPDKSGLELCEAIRRNPATKKTKVIMVTGQRDRDTIVKSFKSGADDYIMKPFFIDELLARVGSKIQRVREDSEPVMVCGNLTAFPERLAVRVGDKEQRLSPLEFSLLSFFLERGERIASRQEILKKVWPNTVVSDRTVDSHIVFLRKRLAGFDHEILTVYGAGYSLKAKR